MVTSIWLWYTCGCQFSFSQALFIMPDLSQLKSVAVIVKMLRTWRLTRNWPETSWDEALWTLLPSVSTQLASVVSRIGDYEHGFIFLFDKALQFQSQQSPELNMFVAPVSRKQTSALSQLTNFMSLMAVGLHPGVPASEGWWEAWKPSPKVTRSL